QQTQSQTQVSEIESEGKSERVQRTEYYFNTLIDQEIEIIEKVYSEKTKRLVVDLKTQLLRLENDYKALDADLNNKEVIKQMHNAMIVTLQTRIKLAQEVLNKITEIENSKNNKHDLQTV